MTNLYDELSESFFEVEVSVKSGTTGQVFGNFTTSSRYLAKLLARRGAKAIESLVKLEKYELATVSAYYELDKEHGEADLVLRRMSDKAVLVKVRYARDLPSSIMRAVHLCELYENLHGNLEILATDVVLEELRQMAADMDRKGPVEEAT